MGAKEDCMETGIRYHKKKSFALDILNYILEVHNRHLT